MNPNMKSFWISVSANVFVVAMIALFWKINRQMGDGLK